MRSKKLNQRSHAKQRAKERYDLELKTSDIKEMIDLIRNSKSIPIFSYGTNNRIKKHLITWNNLQLLVAYDKVRGEIVSFLPKDSQELVNYHKGKWI